MKRLPGTWLEGSGSGRAMTVRCFSGEEGQGIGESGIEPSQICDLAQAADGLAIAQEASRHWPWIAGVQHSLEWIHVTTGSPW